MLIPAACLFTFGVVTLILIRRNRHDGTQEAGARRRVEAT
jgi:hypothetical protein